MSDLRLIKNVALSESGFMFLPTTGETFTANESGRRVLAGLQNGKNAAEIAGELSDEYDASAAEIERDINDFVTQLREYRLLAEGESGE